VFTDAYNDAARIHANSWGSNNSNGRYTAFSEDVDDVVFLHPDLLVVVAAGNAGPGASTVLAPGTAKNCLTVGAAESVRPLLAAITIEPNLQDDDHDPATPKVNVPLALNNFGQQADNADDIAGFDLPRAGERRRRQPHQARRAASTRTCSTLLPARCRP
jgi:serine protease AprX